MFLRCTPDVRRRSSSDIALRARQHLYAVPEIRKGGLLLARRPIRQNVTKNLELVEDLRPEISPKTGRKFYITRRLAGAMPKGRILDNENIGEDAPLALGDERAQHPGISDKWIP